MAQGVPLWLPEGLTALADLALDLRWTWTHEGDRLWSTLSPEIWSRTQNPWLILHSASRDDLEKAARDDNFLADIRRLATARAEYLTRASWFGS